MTMKTDAPPALFNPVGLAGLVCALALAPDVSAAEGAAARRPNVLFLRSERWRYIRYHDGGEELYDHENDPQEFTNLAGEPKHAAVKKDLGRWLPKTDAPTAPRQRGGGGGGE